MVGERRGLGDEAARLPPPLGVRLGERHHPHPAQGAEGAEVDALSDASAADESNGKVVHGRGGKELGRSSR